MLVRSAVPTLSIVPVHPRGDGLLPVVLIFMVLLVNKRDLMKNWVNSWAYNLVVWVTVVVMIGMTLAYTGISLSKSYKLDWDVVENAFVHSDSGDSLKELVEKAIGKHLREEVSL